MMKQGALVSLALLLFLGVGGVVPAGAVLHNVTISNFQFNPANVTIQTGDMVRWTWSAGTHSATSGTGAADPMSGVVFDSGTRSSGTFTVTFNSPGVIPYYCMPHEFLNMKGTITVEGGNTPPTVTNPGTQNGEEFDFFTVTVTANDLDGDPLILEVEGAPAWATSQDNGDNTATIQGTPLLGDAGNSMVTVTAVDPSNDTGFATFSIMIAPTTATVIVAVDFDFVPPEVAIDPGDEVVWSWEEGSHTVTSGTGSADPEAGALFDEPLNSGDPFYKHLFNDVGYFPFFCSLHENLAMRGTVLVGSPTGLGDAPAPGALLRAFPNPFTGSVELAFSLAEAGPVRLEVYDLAGKRVARLEEGLLAAGPHRARWDGRDGSGNPAASGVYFVNLTAGGNRTTTKLFKTR
jgi:plastocyanin